MMPGSKSQQSRAGAETRDTTVLIESKAICICFTATGAAAAFASNRSAVTSAIVP
jgi:hypothetical protein